MGFFDETTWTNTYDYLQLEYHAIIDAQKKQQVKANGGVKKIIFNYPATIVYWNDGDKTVVKCHEDDIWNRWAGFALAVCKKLVCNNDTVKFHRWMKDNCGEEADLPSYSDSETSAEVFSDSLSDVLNGLWNTLSKVEDDD